MKTAVLAKSTIYIDNEGRIITEFSNVNSDELVAIMDDSGSRGDRDPHENTYIYAGVVRLASEHHNLLTDKVGKYIGDKSAFTD